MRDAIRLARVEQAEQTGVVIDLRDADVARLDLLNEALDPIFSGVPESVELFDRGISHGDTPRLWIDIVTYVVMARDKRTYRFLQDTRVGRRIIAESADTADIVNAVTRYVAQRLIERERALAGVASAAFDDQSSRRRGWQIARTIGVFALGMAAGIVILFIAAFIAASGLIGR
ncbi:MAG: hypothetical protein R3D62_01005 [Xanthobacteraceae bacterium]